ncbi:biopolymer transporter ExbD [Paracoccus sp. (in: a-proteobacteria)]|uniref:biopolymer transporter ExbD n=1 Tax=Paracoccus sp. TaxID=267 RepID=UPI0026DF0308|nr:biopolymer transporter ExbD [Paracoccus sp. (in: a-proteobacteria)]MDO5647161.1 biopolymer transporter ExbD [Paracoccus sp. (in: a-proteobacteria)]
MRIDLPPRTPATESIIPMINVVFLLLIFFLLTAQIAPAPPFDLTLPESHADQAAQGRDVLYLSATGELAFQAARGDAVWPLLAAVPGPVELRADAHMPAADVVRVLGRLRGLGGPAAYLVVTED